MKENSFLEKNILFACSQAKGRKGYDMSKTNNLCMTREEVAKKMFEDSVFWCNIAEKAMNAKQAGTNTEKVDEFLASVDDTQDVLCMIESDIGEYSKDIIGRQAEWEEYAKDHGFENDEWMEMANETLETVRLYLDDLNKAMKYLYDLAYKPFDEIF